MKQLYTKKSPLLLALFLLFISCQNKTTEVQSPALEDKIGQMIMVGFRGTTVTDKDPIYKMVADYNLGGVVLYSRDLPSMEKVARNVVSPEQLKTLNKDLQAIDSIPLLIAIDEEGGFVTRLSEEMGFQYHKSHQAIGATNNPDSTKIWARQMASELKGLGINMNFGPVLDVNINPENPIIGARERSFSDSVPVVIENSKLFIKAHQKQRIVCVPKHFPGHGSSDKDSHRGLADVTNTWTEKELIPFKTLIEEDYLEVMMTSHVYNANLDTLPATLSTKTIKNMLRKDYGFEGVIISDDMQMRAIANFYDFNTAIEKAIQAGVDILLFSNNAWPCEDRQEGCVDIPFDAEIAKKAIDHILLLVEEGKISEARINESYNRILKLKATM